MIRSPSSRLYGMITSLSGAVPADPQAIESLFDTNDWPSAWRKGVYPYHHCHSTAHETLGVYSGSATIQFGGPQGAIENRGEAIVLGSAISAS